MENKQPLVNVVMNCYNGERYLKEAIASVYAQTYPHFNIVFVDNCSTDSSPEIAKSFDQRLKYFRMEQRTSLGAARSYALKQCDGDYITFLDTDDLWYPEKLAMQVKAMEENQSYVMGYAGVDEIEPSGKIIRTYYPKYESGDMFAAQLMQFDINMVTPILRAKTLFAGGFDFDPEVKASEEYNLFIRIASRGSIFAIKEILGAWRIYPNSLTEREISRWGIERHYTLDQVIRENPGIEKRYEKAFQEAKARGFYYYARYYVKERRLAEARIAMKNAAPASVTYKILYWSLFLPGLWSLIHSKLLKRKILPQILGIVRVKQ